MPIPDEMMQRFAAMQGGGAQGGAPTAQPGQSPTPGQDQSLASASPAGAPMAKPTQNEGAKEQARAKVRIAMQMLEQSLPSFGADSKEGKSIIKILDSLVRNFGKEDTSDLVPAQLLQMFRALPQMGGGTDVQKAIMQQMRQGQQQPQAPGAMPGQAPQLQGA